jgi:hypothetical protein
MPLLIEYSHIASKTTSVVFILLRAINRIHKLNIKYYENFKINYAGIGTFAGLRRN